MINSERAWVLATARPPDMMPDPKAGLILGYSITFDLKNLGKTVGRVKGLVWDYKFMEKGDILAKEPTYLGKIEDAGPIYGYVLAPGEEARDITIPIAPIMADTFKRVASGDLGLYVWVRLEYFDFSETTRVLHRIFWYKNTDLRPAAWMPVPGRPEYDFHS